MFTHVPPHDGVAALAVPPVSPAARPEVRARAAVAARALLLMDMSPFRLGSSRRPARGWSCAAPLFAAGTGRGSMGLRSHERHLGQPPGGPLAVPLFDLDADSAAAEVP